MSNGQIILPLLSAAGTVSNPYSGNLYNGAVRIGDALNSGTASPTPLSVDGVMESMLVSTLSLSPLAVDGVLLAGRVLTGDLTVPALAADGSLEGPLSLPLLSLDCAMLNGGVSNGAAALPALAASGAILPGGVLIGSAALPLLEVDGSFGTAGAGVLPALALDGLCLAGNVSNGAALLSKFEASGMLFENGVLDGDLGLAQFTASGVIIASNLIIGAVEWLPAEVSGTVLAGSVMAASVTLPLFSLDAQGFTNEVGTANVILPVLSLDGVLVSTVAAPVFTGVVINTRTNAVTTYSGGAFNSLCNFNGLVLAASSAGIVALTGDTDQGAQIDAFLTSGVSDFQSDKLKRVIAGYVGYRAAGDMELTLITDEHHEYIYRIEPRQTAIHPAKVKFGRGCDGLYWQWRLANRSGADFSLDSLRLDAEVLSRRV